MFNFMKYITAALFGALFLAIIAYGTALYISNGSYLHNYEQVAKAQHLTQVVGEPYFTDTNGARISTIKMGSHVILHQNVLRRNMDCFAMYITSFKQPNAESVQFPPRWTTNLVTADVVLQVPIGLDIPKDMTPGTYSVMQTAFPTCSSFTMLPYDTGMKLTVRVER